ncbi:glycosyltransferase [Acinetobacter sp. ANC 3791]|uniref:glycosyltransferase n=1 Tax=Acinetobacter sp. ANC 3791 TaxID=2529836 RepID=UPI00103A4946|nr:glycosyltransferase [Acinetobacter sp. ANC 3791]TCB83971.1 glycosyltransferase [Acinetobacter sp. ANC 3791]
MKILLLITGLGLGGAEKVVTSLADQLFDAGYQVKIAYLRGEIDIRPQHAEIELIQLGLNSLANFSQSAQRFAQIMQKFQPDVVHAHMFHAILFARLLRRSAQIPYLICTAHSKAIGGKARQLLYRLTDRYSDLNTNVSQEATDFFIAQKAFSAVKSTAVSNGIDTQKFQFSASARQQLRQQLGYSAEIPVLMAVGRLMQAKDYPNLIQAFSLLQKTQPKAQLLIVGDGVQRTELEQQVQQLGLADRIRFLGVRHDIAELLSAADVFVLSSAWEGFGLVVAEAMSCERVVVATDCGGVKEVLGEPEWLVPPQNAEMLSKKLVQALQLSTEQKAQLGQQHRQRIQQHYSMHSMLQQWLALYHLSTERTAS